MTVTTGLVSQGATEVSFAGPCRTRDEAIAMALHPLGGPQLIDLSPLQTA